jgi:cytosol alanyl aminopeptidase
VSAVARYAGDRDLATEARTLTDKWLADHTAVPAEIVPSVLATAAQFGDLELFNGFLAALRNTQDRQEKQRLLGAMSAFHDRAAIQAGMQAVLKKQIPLADGFVLLLSAGNAYSDTHSLPFEFVKQHFDEITAGHPSIFGDDLGAFLPFTGEPFCDAASRDEWKAFFGPLVDKFAGAPRNFAQTLENIDLCIARKTAQKSSVEGFLAKY